MKKLSADAKYFIGGCLVAAMMVVVCYATIYCVCYWLA